MNKTLMPFTFYFNIFCKKPVLKIKEDFLHKHRGLDGNLNSPLLDLKKNDLVFIYIYCINSASSRTDKVTSIFYG